MKLLIIGILALMILIWTVRRGYRRGLAAELRMFVSVIIAALCLMLIILLRGAVKEHTYGTVAVAAGALVILGTGWRFIRLIISPLSGFKELGIVRAADSFLGAVTGLVEGVVLVWLILRGLEAFDLIEPGIVGVLNI